MLLKQNSLRQTIYAVVIALGGFVMVTSAQPAARYEPNWQSLDRRPLPRWFDDAKFGIFIHWGVYSAPAWAPVEKSGQVKGNAPYAEWYWKKLETQQGPTWEFHVRTYGAAAKYQDFAPAFKAEMFQPDEWAELFARSGARYVVLTAKHHDGFCLWPSAQSWNWNSVDVGPHRDLVGELTRAVRARGLRMGLYYSLYEWYHPLYLADPPRYVDEHMLPQLKDLVERYQPALIFADGEWPHPSAVWKSEEFLAWLYNQAPNRDEVVVNDRWGKETRNKHGGYYTTEYGKVHFQQEQQIAEQHKWEENRGIGASFGYNRNEAAADYRTTADLLYLLIEQVSRGGNLLLDVGPTADGRIPVIMQDRLLEMGRWLEVNGEAIYGTRRWRESGEGERVRYTSKDGAVYAITRGWPGRELTLGAPVPTKNTVVTMLGLKAPLKWRRVNGKMVVEVPPLSVDEAPSRHAYAFKLTEVE